MPTPTERLEVARALLALKTEAADCCAVHAAYYAAFHHVAQKLPGVRIRRPKPTPHDRVATLAQEYAASDFETLVAWSGYRDLLLLRYRADYHDDDPPSHEEAEMAVEIATLILGAAPRAEALRAAEP